MKQSTRVGHAWLLCGCLGISPLFCICAYIQIRLISMGFHADKGTRIYFPNPHSWIGSLYRLHNRKYAVIRKSKCLHKPHTLCGKALVDVRKPQCIGANKKIRMANSTMYYVSILDFIFSDFEDKRKNRANVPWLICFASTRTLESAPFSSRETFSKEQEAADAISRETY